jgi:hypothetical protein
VEETSSPGRYGQKWDLSMDNATPTPCQMQRNKGVSVLPGLNFSRDLLEKVRMMNYFSTLHGVVAAFLMTRRSTGRCLGKGIPGAAAALVLLVAGCGDNEGTGLLALSISAEDSIPPTVASSVVLSMKGIKARTYQGAFPPSGGGALALEFPNLPASDSPVAITAQAFDGGNCLVATASKQVTIKAGGKTTADILLGRAGNTCGDGGASPSVDAISEGTVSRSDVPATGVDGAHQDDVRADEVNGEIGSSKDSSFTGGTVDAPQGAFAETGSPDDARGASDPAPLDVADVPVALDAPSDARGGGGAPAGGGTTGNGAGGATGGTGAGGGGGTVTVGSSAGGTATGGAAAGGGAGGAAGGATSGSATGGTGGGGTAGGATGGAATGGAATGGIATGGMGAGGAGGTGGSPVCQVGATKCQSTSRVQTCTESGQWDGGTACGTRQTCTGPDGTAQCACKTDPVCGVVGATCVPQSSTLADCRQDDDACFYQYSTQSCTNGACSGPAGGAACCTNECTFGATCLSSTSVRSCTLGSNGCTKASTTNCAAGLICERLPPAECGDPAWAQWPMPNSEAGTPNPASYTNNNDGTVTDNVTGLMWQRDAPSDRYLWTAVAPVCPALRIAGYSDWRLPTMVELLSIVDYTQSSPAINSSAFPSTPADYFWCSCPGYPSSSQGGTVAFHVGNAGCGVDTSDTNHIRCVR